MNRKNDFITYKNMNNSALNLDYEKTFNVEELILESYSNMKYVGETIEDKAKNMLNNYNFDNQSKTLYTYLMREVMRNVVEHSMSKEFKVILFSDCLNEFCFKVIDYGIGIRKSLNTNPSYYDITDDSSALLLSIIPGVTRSYKRDPLRDDVWQNSGFGLYMVSSLVDIIGIFEIESGDSKIIKKNGFLDKRKCKTIGTTVTITINNNIEINIKDTLKKISKEGSKIAKNSCQFAQFSEIKTASQASTLIK